MTEVLDSSKDYYAFYHLEQFRQALLANSRLINIKDLGAGSKINNKATKHINQIAKTALSSKNQCRALFNLVNYIKADSILELGTSLGLSAAYMSKARQKAQIISIEGDPEIASLAAIHFKQLGLRNIQLMNEEFDKALDQIADKSFDFIYIDGNHQYESTLNYYNRLKGHLTPKGFIMLDDINWSSGMQRAWKEIKLDKTYNCKLDLFHFGLVNNNTDLIQAIDVSLIEFKYKPFELGLFSKYT